ncbi:MAG: hypothetical protein BWY70_00668 [Bacteroidetes bacterium ADurb.Bin408]|nr:MAG: hypothetical protein BWY70_00668 [Bacteroidetes bacterium ADurb.Bin408]
MTTRNPIDDLFSKGLGNYTEQPSASVWKGIEKKLNARRMWFKGFYLTGALLVLIGLTAVSIWVYQNYTIPLSKNADGLKPSNGISDMQPEVVIKSESKTPSAPETKPSVALAPITEHQNEGGANQVKAKKSSYNSKNVVTPTSISGVLAENTKPVPKLQNPITQPLTAVNETIGQKPSAEAVTMPTSSAAGAPIPTSVTEEKTPVSPQPREVQKENTAITPEIKQEATENTGIQPDESAAEKQNDSLATTTLLDKSNVLSPTPPATSYSPYKPRFEVLFYAMPSYVFKSFTGLTKEESAFRRKNEVNTLFVDYGMEFRCTLKDITVQTGIVQRQLGEKYAYAYDFIKDIDTTGGYYNVVITSHPDTANSGNTIITFDSSWVSLSDTTTAMMKLNHLNVYKYMEVPFNLGYVMNHGQHQVGFSGGISMGLLSYASSALLNSSTNEIIPIATQSLLLNKVIWSYNLSLYYGYHVSGQTTLFMQAAYNKNLNGILKNCNFNIKYQSADAKIGVMFKL